MNTLTHKYEYATYRGEWQLQFGEVDQYGQNFKSYRSYSFPSQAAAQEFRQLVATESPHVKGRWIPDAAPHAYCRADILYCRVPVPDAIAALEAPDQSMIAMVASNIAKSHVEPKPNNSTVVSDWLNDRDIEQVVRTACAALAKYLRDERDPE
jgi:hypothetical protein